MSVNRYDASTGELVTLASGTRTWIGTKAAYEAARSAGTLPNNCLIAITDDEDDTIATEVVKDDFRAVSGGAVYNYLNKTFDEPDITIPVVSSRSWNDALVALSNTIDWDKVTAYSHIYLNTDNIFWLTFNRPNQILEYYSMYGNRTLRVSVEIILQKNSNDQYYDIMSSGTSGNTFTDYANNAQNYPILFWY